MVCQQAEETLVNQITHLFHQISRLDSLKPSPEVDELFTKLVSTCIPPSKIDVLNLCPDIQAMRSKLIRLCGQAEGLLEKHYSTILSTTYPENPLQHLNLFPYFENYLKLSSLEFNVLRRHSSDDVIQRVAFVGSGPLPLTSIVLAMNHLPEARFDNYDLDRAANEMAARLVGPDAGLSARMGFHTKDVMDLEREELEGYDVVFLAALVGMDREEKVEVVHHLARNMGPGATLMVRSAHGARAFLYPVVDPDRDLCGFEVLDVVHPTNDVINSVIVARKPAAEDRTALVKSKEWDPLISPPLTMQSSCCKCTLEINAFNRLNCCKIIEELAINNE